MVDIGGWGARHLVGSTLSQRFDEVLQKAFGWEFPGTGMMAVLATTLHTTGCFEERPIGDAIECTVMVRSTPATDDSTTTQAAFCS